MSNWEQKWRKTESQSGLQVKPQWQRRVCNDMKRHWKSLNKVLHLNTKDMMVKSQENKTNTKCIKKGTNEFWKSTSATAQRHTHTNQMSMRWEITRYHFNLHTSLPLLCRRLTAAKAERLEGCTWSLWSLCTVGDSWVCWPGCFL